MTDDEEDAAYEERLRRHREEVERKWGGRPGLVALDARPQADAIGALRRSLPAMRDAERLFDLVFAGLGARAVLDVWATANERCLLVRDRDRPEWLLPHRFLYLIVDWKEPEYDGPPMSMDGIPPVVQRAMARRQAEWDARPKPDELVVALAPGGRPGRLRISEEPAFVTLTYRDDGRLGSCHSSAGDPYMAGQADERPFTIDPCARPPQVPPPSLLLDPSLDPAGMSVAALAERVLAMRPDQADRGRVRVPVPQPGNAIGAWSRGLMNLRSAEWAGELGDAGGWAVADAWNGAAIAVGPDFDAAYAAWRALVAQVQPLPPVEGRAPAPPPPPDDAIEPEEPLPDGPIPLPRDGELRIATGPIHIELHPPVVMAWPEPRPEHVPAAIVPIPARCAMPARLEAAGFDRVLRLFGEDGQVGFAFVRDEPGGFTLVGDDAAAVLDLDTLEADMARIDEAARNDWFGPSGKQDDDPFVRPKHPVRTFTYQVWDDLWRTPALRGGGMGWGGALGEQHWGLERRHGVMRVRYVRVIGQPG